MSIHTFHNKIKGGAGEGGKTLLILGLLVAVAVISFYLGYVARAETAQATPVLIECPAEAYIPKGALSGDTSSKTSLTLPKSGAYVASKNGTKYYSLDCSGVSRIKEENKIWFDTAESAESAGYSLAVACQ